ncbi:L-threonylcarbamoyladenylate synthase [Nanoarchaeota archaeon]
METLTKSELAIRREEIMERIVEGEIFIHPTDTIYGIGCNALDEKAIKKLRVLKERSETPFSVWAPSKEWIIENCDLGEEGEKWIEDLPGPYTLVLKLKNKSAIAKSVNPGNSTIGVRLPDHWFSVVVSTLNIPIVTTSANRMGSSFMTSVENLDPEVKKGVRFIVYEGEKKGRPSKIINLAEKKTSIKER